MCAQSVWHVGNPRCSRRSIHNNKIYEMLPVIENIVREPYSKRTFQISACYAPSSFLTSPTIFNDRGYSCQTTVKAKSIRVLQSRSPSGLNIRYSSLIWKYGKEFSTGGKSEYIAPGYLTLCLNSSRHFTNSLSDSARPKMLTRLLSRCSKIWRNG